MNILKTKWATNKLIVPLIFAFALQSCRPRITSIFPTSGAPGTLVHVTGADLFGGLIKWDAGSMAERTLPGGFLAATFFTVPMDAALGAHNVRLFGDRRYSENSVVFTVTGGTRRPAPRIDDITCRNFTINSDGRATFLMMVHGANIDAGAQIYVGGTLKQTSFWRGLSNRQNMQAVDPSTLGYPIFHYGTVLCLMENVLPGVTLNDIAVRNIDGLTSINRGVYHVAADMRHLDSDGDGLTDAWEQNGADVDSNGSVDVDLPALGADPFHKDLFLEVDWMPGRQPEPELWSYADTVFANAPVLNSDGSSGISIHIDHGQPGAGGGGGSPIPYSYGLLLHPALPCYPLDPPGTRACGDFFALKRAHFNPNRLTIYRYCIFGYDNANGNVTGEADGTPGNDFIVTIGGFMGPRDIVAREQIVSFLHELGHTLGSAHGGDDGLLRKPNYNSIMNYRFNNEGIDIDCDLEHDDYIFTYSQGMRRQLDERCLDERIGICDNHPYDWNHDGVTTNACVDTDVDQTPPFARTILRDYADWPNFKIDFKRDTTWHRD